MSNAKSWAILGPRFAPVVQARGRNIRVAEPFLDLGDIRFVIERIRGNRRAQRMNAKAVDLGIDAGLAAVFAHDVVIDGIRIEPAVKFLGAIVCDWTEEGTGGILAMAGAREVFLDEPAAPWREWG
jgi:hypothetical protein